MMKQTVVARRIADFHGPLGWSYVGTQLGTFKPVGPAGHSSQVRLSIPDVLLLTEIRTDFTLEWAAIDAFERMGPILEQDTIEEAARETALAEDRFVFYGTPGRPGLLTSTSTPRVALSDWSMAGRVVTDLLSAVEKLDEEGVKGPYEAVLSPAHYYAYLRNTAEGYPAAKQVGLVVEKVHSSPAVDGAVLFSTRGGDFVITMGGDFSIGYRWHDDRAVHLFCAETIAAQLLTPHALCLIKPD
jgi:uncharacterized linocin/CFP29 family protein